MNAITLETIHKQATRLQEFSAQTNRKLTRAKALEQAAQLNDYENYETAIAVIAKQTLNQKSLNDSFYEFSPGHGKTITGAAQTSRIEGEIEPWDSDGESTNGAYQIQISKENLSVLLFKESDKENCLEVTFEMDADHPRAIVYRSGKYDEAIFSIHSGTSGAVLQYMGQDNQMFHKNRANAELAAQIALVAQTNDAWIVPDPS